MRVGVTSPYALFSCPEESELQRRFEVTIAGVIGGNGWAQPICAQTGIRRTRSAGCAQDNPQPPESRGRAAHTETDMLTPCAQTVEQREARERSGLFTAPTWRLAEPPPWSHSSAGRSNAETFSAGLVPGAQRHRGGRRRSAGAAFRDVRAADHWHALPMPNEGTTVECPAPLQTRRSPRHATASTDAEG